MESPQYSVGQIRLQDGVDSSVVNVVADGLDAADVFLTSLGPDPEHFAIAPLVGVLKAAAVDTKAARAATQLAENAKQGANGEAITAAKLGDKVAVKA